MEQTSTPEEGNRGSRAIPEIIRIEVVCVSVSMNRVTGTLPLCGELCVPLCDRVGMCLILQGVSSFCKTEWRCGVRV